MSTLGFVANATLPSSYPPKNYATSLPSVNASLPGVVVDDLGSGLQDVVERVQGVHQPDLLAVVVRPLGEVQVMVAVHDAEQFLGNKSNMSVRSKLCEDLRSLKTYLRVANVFRRLQLLLQEPGFESFSIRMMLKCRLSNFP